MTIAQIDSVRRWREEIPEREVDFAGQVRVTLICRKECDRSRVPYRPETSQFPGLVVDVAICRSELRVRSAGHEQVRDREIDGRMSHVNVPPIDDSGQPGMSCCSTRAGRILRKEEVAGVQVSMEQNEWSGGLQGSSPLQNSNEGSSAFDSAICLQLTKPVHRRWIAVPNIEALDLV